MKKSNNLMTHHELLYANDKWIAVHKKPGVPCQTRSNDPPYPVDASLERYLGEPLNLWTRIDQPVSGIVLLYRGKKGFSSKDLVVTEKYYLGIVEGHLHQDQNTIVSNLRRDGRKMKAVEDDSTGKRSELSYTVLKKFDRYTLLMIQPDTGRFHQIRQQLASIGHPIKGDVKYGARRKNHDRSIHLHAAKYVIHQANQQNISVYDYSLPHHPLWTLTGSFIDQEKPFS